ALMQSEGEGGYRDTDIAPRPASQDCPAADDGTTPERCRQAVREGDGEVEASLTAAVPYAALQASERLRLWGAAGYGTGEVKLTTGMGQALKADIDWTMAAAGLRGDLLPPPSEGSGPALALTSDALWARTASEKTAELAAGESDVTRLRLGLEGSWRVAMEGGGSIVPKLTLGARHDGGDAETGFGVELGGGLAWNDPGLGLTLDIEGRTLIAHGNDDLKDRGYAASLAFDPDPATRRGPSFSLRQDWGGQATGGLDALFAPNPLEKRTGSGEATSRWQAEAAWGFPAFGDRFTGSPHVGLGLATGTRDWTLGWRLTPAAANANAPDLSLGLKATRRESDTAEPEHSVGFEITARW
ncbi:MAG: autotransporter outer membrane beta-barrel domain-containing protein, partial [Rhodospirillaceae bacterium]|nr:autotransporter outer membrane beta-barrel domain-containing protein [Rhodospirillaceae bacterium]